MERTCNEFIIEGNWLMLFYAQHEKEADVITRIIGIRDAKSFISQSGY
jgi:hypothetical protein